MEKEKTNPRKGKRPLTLWMSEDEIKEMLDVIADDNYRHAIGREIQKINKRGDLEVR